MTFKESLIDTDILSFFMGSKDPQVMSKVSRYLDEFDKLNFSIITYFEVLRGLKAKNATTKIRQFRELMGLHNVINIDTDIIERASDIYADLKKTGNLIDDADLLVAATAIVKGMVLITNNIDHFRRVEGLQMENWLTGE